MAKIKDNTDGVLREVDRRIIKNLRTSGLMVERTAKQLLVPGHGLITGTLKRSILSNWYGAKGSRSISWNEDKKKGIKAGKTAIDSQQSKQAIIGTNLEYAPYVEMGTKNMSARPYLRPALEANMDRIRRLFSGI